MALGCGDFSSFLRLSSYKFKQRNHNFFGANEDNLHNLNLLMPKQTANYRFQTGTTFNEAFFQIGTPLVKIGTQENVSLSNTSLIKYQMTGTIEKS